MSPSESAHEFYSAVPIQIMMISSVDQLKEILYKIENDEKIFVVRNLRVRAIGGSGVHSIEATMTVEGYMKVRKG
jgi:hypothetical protein